MSQTEVNHAVARATGVSVTTIKRLGFLIADPGTDAEDSDDKDLGPYMLDWDELDEQRLGSGGRELEAACV